jgi:hypothetical protein
MGNCQSDGEDQNAEEMTHLQPRFFDCGTIYRCKEDLKNAANDHNHSIGKGCRVYRCQPSVLHLVCTHQYMAMKRIDKQNAQARKDITTSAGDTNGEFVKLEYPSLCRGYLKAHPLTKSTMESGNAYTTEAVIINEVYAHSCSGPPHLLLEAGVLPTVTTIWLVLHLMLFTQIPTLDPN